MDDIRDILIFVEVARARSFKKAGEVLGMPTSTVSRRIAGLERRLATQLVHRTSRQVRLTTAGDALLVQSGTLVHDFQQALAESLASVGRIDRPMRVTMPIDFGTIVLLPIFHTFCTQHPEARFEFIQSSDRLDLVVERIDLALRFGALDNSRFVARRLANIRKGLYASPDFLQRCAALTQPSDLEGLRSVVMPSEAQARAWTLYRGEQTAHIPVTGWMVANTVGAVRSLACFGVGIAALDHAVVADDVTAGRLRPVLPEWSLEPLPLYALTTARTPSRLIGALIEHVAKQLALCDPEAPT